MAIQFLQASTCAGSTLVTVAGNFALGVNTGDCVIVLTGTYGGITTPPTVVDNGGNIYSIIDRVETASPGAYIFVAFAASPATTVTVTHTVISSSWAATTLRYSGVTSIGATNTAQLNVISPSITLNLASAQNVMVTGLAHRGAQVLTVTEGVSRQWCTPSSTRLAIMENTGAAGPITCGGSFAAVGSVSMIAIELVGEPPPPSSIHAGFSLNTQQGFTPIILP